FRMALQLPDFKAYGSDVIEKLQTFAAAQPGWALAPDNHEGVRVDLDKEHGNGWFLLRMSLHEPLLPLNIESDSPGGVKTIARELFPFLSSFDKLDTSSLAGFIR
ncbi:MAG: phosphomannomutase/phosphoglucomutase, partial [Clostridia bacterium]|nr:phosphomannomutase/phosphoglucomutase [Clostridia bacterium]